MLTIIFWIVFGFIFIYNFSDWAYKYSNFALAYCKAELELINRLQKICEINDLTEEDEIMIRKALKLTSDKPPMFAYKDTTPEKLFYDTFREYLDYLNKFEELRISSKELDI